jgi:hypothetical protein
LLKEVDERRNPKTNRTLDQLLDRYLEVLDVDAATRRLYVSYIDNHIRPVLGKHQIGRLDGEDFDRLYAQLRRCRGVATAGQGTSSTGRSGSMTVTRGAESSHASRSAHVRQIHWILSGA